MCMRNSALWLILALLPIIQHFQDAAYYSKNYSSIISSGLPAGAVQRNYDNAIHFLMSQDNIYNYYS